MFTQTTGGGVRDSGWTAVEVTNADGRAPLVLVCEHAAAHIPPDLDDLGLDAAARYSHAAWDIGARDVAVALAKRLDAPLLAGTISRLVYDLNRPADAPDAIPAYSEIHAVPGNRDLSAEARAERHARIHTPFHATLAELLDRQTARAGSVALITVHSFTPVYRGARRAVDLGFLHDADPGLAEAALAAETARGLWRAALNEPYSAADGVTHTLELHGTARNRPALMIEIRNDLIDTPDSAAAMAEHLAGTLRAVPALRDAEGAP
ncbi:N-formylglutamate amidohydrolase [Roseivivax sp. CAU 1761]